MLLFSPVRQQRKPSYGHLSKATRLLVTSGLYGCEWDWSCLWGTRAGCRSKTYGLAETVTLSGGGGGLVTKSCPTLAIPWTAACLSRLAKRGHSFCHCQPQRGGVKTEERERWKMFFIHKSSSNTSSYLWHIHLPQYGRSIWRIQGPQRVKDLLKVSWLVTLLQRKD